MSSPVGGSRYEARGRSGGGWQEPWAAHERQHERRDHELDRRYHALENRVRNVERVLYVMTGVLVATTATAVFNLINTLASLP